MLYATPLRINASGRVRPGLCSGWSADLERRAWVFFCRFAPAIAQELRRVTRLKASPAQWMFRGARITAPTPRNLVVRLAFPWRRFPYALTAVAAAPRDVPGPFRLVRASSREVVTRRGSTTLVFRRLAPAAAVRAFRAGELDEAPVPIGDADLLRRAYDVRSRRLLALDLLAFGPRVDPRLRRAYADTANRTDYQTLLDTSAAYRIIGTGESDPGAFRRALKEIPELPRRAVRIARPPALDYGADVLYGQWREAGLGPVLVRPDEPHDAELVRLVAPYPPTEALPAAVVLGRGLGNRGEILRALARVYQEGPLAMVGRRLRAEARVVPIAWVTDERLVSRRLHGWREGALGGVNYARVRIAR